MEQFADLLDSLALTPSRNGKLALMADCWRTAGDPARGWTLATLAGALDLPGIRPAAIRKLIAQRMDHVLFELSYDFVGDLAETVSLVWPAGSEVSLPHLTLDSVLAGLRAADRTDASDLLARLLDCMDARQRWALLKLVTGGLRVGVSQRLARVSLAEYGGVDINEIEEIWHGLSPPYESLFAWLDGRAERPRPDFAAPFRPVMLAHPLISRAQRRDEDGPDPGEVDPETYAAEWKYDGIRVQLVGQDGVRRIYTRTGDDISASFPDLLGAMAFEGAIDGELLVRAPEGGAASFNALQRRLNRKAPGASQMHARPAFVRAYDLLLDGKQDLRALPLRDRRARLETFIHALPEERFELSPLVAFSRLADLENARTSPPSPEIEGVMLKRWDSPYLAGRPKGPWFKWKRDPFLVDAVLLYAQRGHGRRSGFYSDFTFGVWRDDAPGELTPVGKAYFGFSDDELKRLDQFVRENTTDRFGPVCAVTAGPDNGLVLEIAFEGLLRSTRHKSGLAMRFPRIHRIRWDKPAAEADRLSALSRLLPDAQ